MVHNKLFCIVFITFFILGTNIKLLGQSLYEGGGIFKGKVKTVLSNYSQRRFHIWWSFEKQVNSYDTSHKLQKIIRYSKHTRGRIYEEKRMKYVDDKLVEINREYRGRNYKEIQKGCYFYNHLGQLVRDSIFNIDSDLSKPIFERVEYFYSYSDDGKYCYNHSLKDSSILVVYKLDSFGNTIESTFLGNGGIPFAIDIHKYDKNGDLTYLEHHLDKGKPDVVYRNHYLKYDSKGNWVTRKEFEYEKVIGRKRNWKKQTRIITYY